MPDPSDHDAFAERGRALEGDYFRKKDRELIEKMRAAADAQQARAEIGRKTGLDDPELIRELQDLGFTPDTLGLLPLVPVIQVAWAEGGITKAERELIVRLARGRVIEAASAADAHLTAWLTNLPAEKTFASARRLIRAMLDSGSEQARDFNEDDLVTYSEQIASASGGMFGIGRISAEERALLDSIAADLKARRS